MKISENSYKKHIFVCVNERMDGRSSCSEAGKKLYDQLKRYVKENKLNGRVRISQSGCFDFCEQGPNVLVFPDYTWYRKVSPEDLKQIIEKHLMRL